MGLRKKNSSPSSTLPCADLRTAYNNCFYRWYSEKYVKREENQDGCVSELKKYKICLEEHLDDRLRPFLEAEEVLDSFAQADMGKPVDDAEK